MRKNWLNFGLTKLKKTSSLEFYKCTNFTPKSSTAPLLSISASGQSKKNTTSILCFIRAKHPSLLFFSLFAILIFKHSVAKIFLIKSAGSLFYEKESEIRFKANIVYDFFYFRVIFRLIKEATIS